MERNCSEGIGVGVVFGCDDFEDFGLNNLFIVTDDE